MNQVIAVIPSRYESSRFPGKPLASILGKPMIQWVYEAVSSVPEVDRTYVATDDERIYEAVESFGGRAIMTGLCACGTDRIYQAIENLLGQKDDDSACLELDDTDIIVNIQGDEPAIAREMVQDLIHGFDEGSPRFVTLRKEMDPEDIDNPNTVKVICDMNSDAIYFSRHAIPYNRDGVDVTYYKHVGAYAYRPSFLAEFVHWERTSLEIAENLEQLRAVEHGVKIRTVETKYQSVGVDLPEHIPLVEEALRKAYGI